MFPTVTTSKFALAGKTIGGNLHLTNGLGAGGFGTVYRAVTTNTKQQFAVKVVVAKKQSKSAWADQLRELHFHAQVSGHQNIVTLHRAFSDLNHHYFVFEACLGGDLHSAITDRATYFYNDELAKHAFVQLLDAVAFCHSKGIYHRDLKPDNVLCSADGSHLYLTDFGLATDNMASTNFHAGSSFYMSPECIHEDFKPQSYSPEHSDIWALGLIFINMTTGRSPWRKAVLADDCFAAFIREPDFLRTLLPLSEAAADLARRTLALNPLSRISLAEFRAGVLAADTLFMTEEDVMQADPYLREHVKTYLEVGFAAELASVAPLLSENALREDFESSSGSEHRCHVPNARLPRSLPRLPTASASSFSFSMLTAGGSISSPSSAVTSTRPVTPETHHISAVAVKSVDELLMPDTDALVRLPCSACPTAVKHKHEVGFAAKPGRGHLRH